MSDVISICFACVFVGWNASMAMDRLERGETPVTPLILVVLCALSAGLMINDLQLIEPVDIIKVTTK